MINEVGRHEMGEDHSLQSVPIQEDLSKGKPKLIEPEQESNSGTDKSENCFCFDPSSSSFYPFPQ